MNKTKQKGKRKRERRGLALGPRRALPLPPSALRRGLSLVEVVLSSVLVGLVVVGALEATGGVLRTWGVARELQRGETLAQHLMAEILQQYYEEPEDTPVFGCEGGEDGNRKKRDDVDDYDGWTGSPPTTKDNVVLEGYDGWTRAVDVAYVQIDTPTQISGSDEGLKRITVTVTDPDGETTTLVAFRSRWGAMEEAPTVDATLEGYASHVLEIGDATLHGGVNLTNHAEDE